MNHTENEEDVRRFKKMIDEKIGEIPSTAKYAVIPKDDWVATITLQTNCEKDPESNEARFDALKQIIKKILSKTDGDGIILFPAGWLNTEKTEPIRYILRYRRLQRTFLKNTTGTSLL